MLWPSVTLTDPSILFCLIIVLYEKMMPRTVLMLIASYIAATAPVTLATTHTLLRFADYNPVSTSTVTGLLSLSRYL